MHQNQPDRRPIDLAEAHVKFLLEWTEYVFVEAFAHGYKHGQEDMEVTHCDTYAHRTQSADFADVLSCSIDEMRKGTSSAPKRDYP
jgi:hypothetical protein